MELDNIDAAKKMVQEGFGVALIPLHGSGRRAGRRACCAASRSRTRSR